MCNDGCYKKSVTDLENMRGHFGAVIAGWGGYGTGLLAFEGIGLRLMLLFSPVLIGHLLSHQLELEVGAGRHGRIPHLRRRAANREKKTFN